MTPERFNKIVENRLLDCRNTLVKKASEYARGDRLSNFKTAGRMDNESPEKSLWGMYKKHLVSLRDFIDDLEHDACMPWEAWEEKIRDTINYAILLEGLIQERIFEEITPEERYKPIMEHWKHHLYEELKPDKTPSDMNEAAHETE